ncbi:MAG: helix-turn-helix domain-containing protein [Armatimonadota bacterium]
MREEKRKRLERKGWKVGSVKEFLNLSAEEAAYIELKLKLADGLRERRRRRRLSQVELARMVKSSQSRVAKMEAGDSSVALDLLIRSLLALGASDRELAKIIAVSEPARPRQHERREKTAPDVPRETPVGSESRDTTILNRAG